MHSRLDILILLIASFAVGALFALTWTSTDHTANHLLIQSASQTRHIALDQNGIYLIKNATGQSEIEIKAHRARFVQSNCAHKICIRQGWLNRTHPVIACVPNGISIQLSSAAQPTRELDGLVF